MNLQEFFQAYPKAALGFSGGVDSSFLLHAAQEAGADVRPYFVKSPFQPRFELEDALAVADQLGVDVTVIEYDILHDPRVTANGADRCYHCKKALFGLLKRRAEADGYSVLLDGTNASDDPSDRPGTRALAEYGVLSPLRLCGLTKDDIRQEARAGGLFLWDKPAYACLATRVATGTPIDAETLQKIEGAESVLTALGYEDFRVRLFHGAARLQLKESQFPTSFAKYDTLRQALRPWFDEILLDLKGR